MRYPEAVNLPFNSTVIKEVFTPIRVGESVPDGPAYWVVLQGNSLVLEQNSGAFRLLKGARPDWIAPECRVSCFGTYLGIPAMAVAVSRKIQLPVDVITEPFNSAEERLDDILLTLGGLANQVLQWDRQSMLCSRCGGTLHPIPLTWGKRCEGCGHEHFPHIHPCIIVLVRHDDKILLTRKPEWPPGRYGLVAGFLDIGESLEECVRREVKEETGLELGEVHYVGSQSWPFPSQLMAGFVAEYASGEIVVDREELEDARWFCCGELPASLPGRRSIARWIIDNYASAQYQEMA